MAFSVSSHPEACGNGAYLNPAQIVSHAGNQRGSLALNSIAELLATRSDFLRNSGLLPLDIPGSSYLCALKNYGEWVIKRQYWTHQSNMVEIASEILDDISIEELHIRYAYEPRTCAQPLGAWQHHMPLRDSWLRSPRECTGRKFLPLLRLTQVRHLVRSQCTDLRRQ